MLWERQSLAQGGEEELGTGRQQQGLGACPGKASTHGCRGDAPAPPGPASSSTHIQLPEQRLELVSVLELGAVFLVQVCIHLLQELLGVLGIFLKLSKGEIPGEIPGESLPCWSRGTAQSCPQQERPSQAVWAVKASQVHGEGRGVATCDRGARERLLQAKIMGQPAFCIVQCSFPRPPCLLFGFQVDRVVLSPVPAQNGGASPSGG